MRNDATGLARKYRMLLFAYPRDYRRDRGEEMVETLLDTAPPGRRRPAVREAANLLTNGMRCQLGRPRSKAIVVVAILGALMSGYLGACAFAWLAWQPARALPDAAAATAIHRTALPHWTKPVYTNRVDSLFYYDEPTDALTMIRGSDDYGPGTLDATFGPTATKGFPDFRAFVRSAAGRLRYAGWQVDSFREHEPTTWAGGELSARKDGLLLYLRYDDGVFTEDANGKRADIPVSLEIIRDTPWWAVPASLIGALVGALAGWLLIGWVSRRSAGHSLIVRLGSWIFGVMAFVGMLPAFAFFTVFMAPGMISSEGRGAAIIWYPLTMPLCRPWAVLSLLAILLTVATAGIARHSRTPASGSVGV